MLEGIRLAQIPMVLGLLPHLLCYFVFRSQALFVVYGLGFGVTLYLVYLTGDCSFNKVKRSGPYRVGYKSFTSHDLENDCAVFYPAANDGSGTEDVRHFCHGNKTLEGQIRATVSTMIQSAAVLRFFLKPQLKVTLSGVYRNAKLGVDTMQPIVISHDVSHNKMLHSMWASELASLGFCVFSLTHKDGSADYAEGVGFLDTGLETWDYWQRQAVTRIRT